MGWHLTALSKPTITTGKELIREACLEETGLKLILRAARVPASCVFWGQRCPLTSYTQFSIRPWRGNDLQSIQHYFFQYMDLIFPPLYGNLCCPQFCAKQNWIAWAWFLIICPKPHFQLCTSLPKAPPPPQHTQRYPQRYPVYATIPLDTYLFLYISHGIPTTSYNTFLRLANS